MPKASETITTTAAAAAATKATVAPTTNAAAENFRDLEEGVKCAGRKRVKRGMDSKDAERKLALLNEE
jgi:hypothetical protein